MLDRLTGFLRLTERELGIYQSMFGDSVEGKIALPTPELIAALSGEFDERWTHVGVLRYSPTRDRTCWLYVTSGLTNPWHLDFLDAGEPAGDISGLGFELLILTAIDLEWAIRLLVRLSVYQLGVYYGNVTGQPISPGQRIPRAPLGIEQTPPWLTGFITGTPTRFPTEFRLATGSGRLIQLCGITTDEFAWSTQVGVPEVFSFLDAQGYTVCPVQRVSVEPSRGMRLPNEYRRDF